MLSVKKVAKLKAPGRYGDGSVPGLYLQITSGGSKSWVLRYERNSRERMLGLGPLGIVSLKDARERARIARLQLLDGIDPLDAKRERRATQALETAKQLTFKEAAAQYYQLHADGWRNEKHRKQFLSTLEAYVHPTIGHLPVSAIDTGLVLRCIEPHWATKTETMSRVRQRVERVLEWCAVRGYRSGDNPAKWRGHLQSALPARPRISPVEHHSALPYAELPAFMIALREREAVAAKALEFLILTAARTGEIIGARRQEIDWKAKVWTIPASRMKAGKEHRVPLAASLLLCLGDDSDRLVN